MQKTSIDESVNSSLDKKKEKKTLFMKLMQKVEKIDTIIME